MSRSFRYETALRILDEVYRSHALNDARRYRELVQHLRRPRFDPQGWTVQALVHRILLHLPQDDGLPEKALRRVFRTLLEQPHIPLGNVVAHFWDDPFLGTFVQNWWPQRPPYTLCYQDGFRHRTRPAGRVKGRRPPRKRGR